MEREKNIAYHVFHTERTIIFNLQDAECIVCHKTPNLDLPANIIKDKVMDLFFCDICYGILTDKIDEFLEGSNVMLSLKDFPKSIKR